MTATENPTTEIHVAPSGLDKALRAAVLCASADQTLPILAAVALTVTDQDNVVAVATDRYSLVRAHIPTLPDETRDVAGIKTTPAIIPAAEAKTILGWLKPRTKGYLDKAGLTVNITHGDAPRMTLTADDGATYAANLYDGDYPKVQSLIKPWEDDAGVRAVALNPVMVERLGKIGKVACVRGVPLEIRLGETESKPVQFRGRDGDSTPSFDGLLMPISHWATASATEL